MSKTKQNILILRYVLFNEEESEWQINEMFLEYFDFHTKTGVAIARAIIAVLKKHGIDLLHCRGQALTGNG